MLREDSDLISENYYLFDVGDSGIEEGAELNAVLRFVLSGEFLLVTPNLLALLSSEVKSFSFSSVEFSSVVLPPTITYSSFFP